VKRILAAFFLFVSFLHGNIFTSSENSVFNFFSFNKDKNSSSKNLYLSYINYPKHIYKNQRFEVEIKALITRNDFDDIQTRFLNTKNMLPLNPNEFWKNSEDVDTYINKFYFKADKNNFVMPNIEVDLYKDGNLLERRVILAPEITFSEIAKSDDRFSNIIASDLNIITSKTKQYTNSEALIIIDMEAQDSNLEDFFLEGMEEQGPTVFEDDYPSQHLIYYLVIPIHKKTIVFNYYNTSLNAFVQTTIPVVLEEELVSTQTDLNPNNSSFEFYKKIIMAILALIALTIFIWKRKKIYLIIFLILTIIFIVFSIPNKTIRLKEGTVIYILPTKNSTIFQKIDKQIVVKDMKRKNGFVKIMFGTKNNNLIGWVEIEDVIKN